MFQNYIYFSLFLDTINIKTAPFIKQKINNGGQYYYLIIH